MGTQTTKSEYLVICRGWEAYASKSLSPEDIQNALKQFYAWFERLSDEGKMKSGHQLAPEGKILSGRKGVTAAPIHESRFRLGYLLKARRSAGRWWSSDKADWKSVVVTWSGRRL